MTAPLARLMPSPARLHSTRVTSKQRSEERRREHRHTAHFTAKLETARGGVITVELADVSTHGCCIRIPDSDDRANGLPRQGSFVSIRLEDSPSPEAARLEAIIRWVRGHTAGMEFLRPVPPERLDWRDLMDFGLEA